MGCFLACFGSSKDRKRIRRKHKVQPRDNRNAGFKQAQPNVFVAQNNLEIPSSSTDPEPEIRVKPERQVSLSPRKKVTFDSNITTYEHVSVAESTEFCVGKEDGGKSEEQEENLAKQSQTQSSSEDSSITSSSGSYPSNHRYQNCRDSDDELDYGESDVEDDEEEDGDDGVLDYDDTYEDVEKLGSKPLPVCSFPEKEVRPNPNARDRSAYVHSVLNPVENLTQWKAVKAKGTPSLKQQKENLTMNQEPQISCSSNPSFRFSCKQRAAQQSKKSNSEIAVDASLSNWLGCSDSSPVNLSGSTGVNNINPEKSSASMGSNSPKSLDDRPILGALTVEEIKQFSATSSPRKSPSRSPDDMPIIGTVGTYWSHSGSGKDSGSASSFKGIPNTTSKYREDKRVNWYSTPFETRLESALKGTGAC